MKEEKKWQKIYRVIMLIIIIALITFVITTILTSKGTFNYTSSNNNVTKKMDELLATVTELINDKYIGEINEEDLIDGALKGLAEGVGDEYTSYYTKKELEDFETETMGNYVGIGVYLQARPDEGIIQIVEPMVGSPAEEAGIKAGDIVLKVDGIEYKPEEIEELTSHVKGEAGSTVTLTVQREKEVLDIEVERRDVHVNYVTSGMLENNIGYIALETFNLGCAEDFKEAYDNLVSQNMKALIVDVRDNGGGIVDEALQIVDLFCEKGETTLIKVDKAGKETVVKSKTDATIKMPVVVLANIGSASASEILVSDLKDNGKAEIVGEKTYGKGVIQELIYLQNGGALKVTSSEYCTPKREKINGKGIIPNYEVQFDYSNLEVDEQLNKALEVIKQKMN